MYRYTVKPPSLLTLPPNQPPYLPICLISVSIHVVILVTALLTPGNASNMPEDSPDNAESAFPAEGMDNDDLGCYSDDEVGPANEHSHHLASPAGKSAAMEVCTCTCTYSLHVHLHVCIAACACS